jgi:hypothetical protein
VLTIHGGEIKQPDDFKGIILDGETRIKVVYTCTHKNEQKESGRAPTCDKPGLTDGTICADCGKILTPQVVIIPTPHTEQTIKGYDATCTKTGLTDGTKCFACGKTLIAQSTISAKGHTEQTIKGYDSTCTKTGLTDGTKCSVCDAILVSQNETEALGHTYDNSYECSRCDYVFATPSKGLKYSLSQDGKHYIVTDLGSCNDTNVVIPYTYEGLPVKAIDEWAFYGYSSLESIIIPSSIETIGDYAFYGCDSITIYCVAESKPSGWSASWNNSSRPVYWYSDGQPSASGNYWCYGDNNEIVIW